MNETATRSLIEKFLPYSSRNAFNTQSRYTLQSQLEQIPQTVTELDPAAFDTQAKIRLYSGASKHWMLSGTNAAAADATRATGGGITIATHGGASDISVVSPLILNSVYSTAWGSTAWLSQKEPIMACTLITAAAITTMRIVFGLKLTNVLPTATDDDQAIVEFDTALAAGINPYWNLVSSAANVDTTVTANTSLPKATVAVSTQYDLAIVVGSDLRPSFYIDRQLAATGPALVTAKTFIPVFGVLSNSVASAKSCTFTNVLVSRKR